MENQNGTYVDTSGIEPTGGHLLVLPKEVEKVTDAGIILPETAREKEQRAATEGTLIAVGPSAWLDLDDGKPWAAIGDTISYSMYAGVFMDGADGKQYVLINDNDVLARLFF